MTEKAEPESAEPTCSPGEHGDGTHLHLDEAAIEKASRLFRAFGDPSRLRLLARLTQSEMCVTELAELERESLSTISQRLRVLRAENIIVRRRRGKHINYALADEHVKEMVANALDHAAERRNPITGSQPEFEKENLP